MVTESGGVYSGHCPARALLDRIANKWTTLIIGKLIAGPTRFGELRRSITGISQKMLTQSLRELERDGLVIRTVHSVMPPRVEYSLTPLGQTLKEPLGALSRWSEQHWDDVTRAQEAFDRGSDHLEVISA